MQLVKIFIKREQQHKYRHIYELNDCLWGWLYILVWWSQYHNHMCTVIWWLYIHWLHNKCLTAFASSIGEYHMLQLYFWIVSVSCNYWIYYTVQQESLVGECLANLTNCQWFANLKPSKLVLTTNNLLADLLIHKTSFAKCLKRVNSPQTFPCQTFPLYGS